MEKVAAEALEMVVAAERLGFDVAWAAEHHTIEYTIAPNPLIIVMHWAAHARRMRLGTAVITAPYWTVARFLINDSLVRAASTKVLELWSNCRHWPSRAIVRRAS